MTLFLIGSITIAKSVHAAVGDSVGKYSKMYGGYETSTSYHTINGIVAWCINPELPGPIKQEYMETVFNDIGVYNILYYAEKNGYDKNQDDYIDTYVALNWYLGKPTSEAKQNDPTVKYLYNKAKNPDAPMGAFDIQNKNQTASFQTGNTYQETGWYKPVTDGTNLKYTINVPSGITLVTSDGQTKGAGNQTLNQNQSFKLRASVEYSGTVTLTANTNILKKRALVFLPNNPGVQRLANLGTSEDPVTVPDIKAKFIARTGKGTIYKEDKSTKKKLSGATFSVKNLNTGKTSSYTTNSNGYIGWGEALIGHKLEITETKAPTNYILDETNQTITVKNGTNNNVTFKNDSKAELQLSKVEITTDKSVNGLPIKITTKRVKSSPTANQKTINVSVYEKSSNKKVLSLPYKIGDLPSVINARIPANFLTKDTKNNYIVKLEIDSKYAFVTDGYDQIDTDGYTASEKQLVVQAKNVTKIDYKGVIKTERTIKQAMKIYYENFSIPTNKINKQKTGYGFERNFKSTYSNDLNNKATFNLFLTIDSKLIDTYLPYAKNSGKSEVKMDLTSSSSKTNVYELPKVNVEEKTGALFTDQQVNGKDSRIKNKIKDGGKKLYVPIWAELGDYDLAIQNREPIGTNQISIKINDKLNLYAYMLGHIGSETIDQDEILLEPLLHDNPFANGIPDNWGYKKADGTKELTDQEKDWFNKEVTNKTVTVKFDLNGGTGSISDLLVSIGDGKKIPSQIPKKTNYIFEGWTEGDRVYKAGDTIKPSNNVILKALWVNDQINISYNVNGGENSPVSEDVNAGSNYALSETIPEKEGYNFVGWKYGGQVLKPGSSYTTAQTDITFEAVWEESKQTITFNADGGTNSPAKVSVKSNTNYTIPKQVPTRINYIFTGWEYDGTVYQPGTDIQVINEDIELKAIWDLKSVEITFNSNGGFNEPADETIEAGKPYTLPDDKPTKNYSQFMGWKSSLDGKTYQPGSTLTLTDKSIEFVATWKTDEQLINFDNNGGTSTLTTAKAEVNVDYTIPTTKPTKLGFNFIGWGYEGKVYQPGETIMIPDKDITLTAQWEIGRYLVSYNLDGGKDALEAEYIGYGMEYGITSVLPIKDGHIFKGWKSNVDGKTYQAGTVIKITTETILTAQWEIKTYTVSFNGNGGDNPPSSQTKTYGVPLTLSNVIPTKTGYRFDGWNTKIDGTGTNYSSSGVYSPNEDVTLYAKWVEQSEYIFTLINHSPEERSSAYGFGTLYGLNLVAGQRYYMESWGSIDQQAKDNNKYLSIYLYLSDWSWQKNQVIDENGWAGSYFTALKSEQYILNGYYYPNDGKPGSAYWTNTTLYQDDVNNPGTSIWKKIDKGQQIVLPKPNASKTGSTFDGWKNSMDGKLYQPGNKITISSDKARFNAQWTVIKHTVSHDLSSGSGSFSNSTINYGDSHKISTTKPTRTGYTFNGWKSSADGKIYQPGSSFVINSDVKLTAQWTINKHTAKYDGVGNASKVEDRFLTLTSVPGQQTVNYGSQITIPTTKPKRKEHTFEFTFTGWKNSADGKTYQPGAKVTVTKDTTLTALWSEGSRVHTVKDNDTLYSLAIKLLGSASKVNELKTKNKLTSDKIYVEQKLRY